jgi:ATP-dependent protease ClpP protease subunit
MERDRFFTPQEAAEYGLIDRVQVERSERERQRAGFTGREGRPADG